MSWSVAVRVGRSSRRDTGITGNTWSTAHESGRDWNSEKLQKYLSGSILEILRSSSGGCFICAPSWPTSRAISQNSFSANARLRRSMIPRENMSSTSSRICRASCQLSKILCWSSLSQISYSSFTSSCSSPCSSSSSRHVGSCVVSSTSHMSTEWWAVRERPLSVTMLGCGSPFFSHASTMEYMASLAYSWIE